MPAMPFGKTTTGCCPGFTHTMGFTGIVLKNMYKFDPCNKQLYLSDSGRVDTG